MVQKYQFCPDFGLQEKTSRDEGQRLTNRTLNEEDFTQTPNQLRDIE